MKASMQFEIGDIVRPMPKDMAVKQECLILPDGEVIHHSEHFNAIIISHFLIAVKSIQEGGEVLLNFNATFYDLINNKEFLQKNENPVVSGFRFLSEDEKSALYMYADETVRNEAVSNGFMPRSTESGIRVERTAQQELMTMSDANHAAGAVVFRSTGVLLPFPVRSTVELPGEKHLRLAGGAEFLFHSCLPNIRLSIEGSTIVGIALRPIEEGEALTFNYLCTEWEVTKIFHCACNVYCCYGVIKGFKYLDAEQQQHLISSCSAAVQEKYNACCSVQSKALPALPYHALLSTSANGFLASQRYIPAGTVLFQLSRDAKVEKGFAILDQLRVPHGCDANTVVVSGSLVTARPLVPGDVLTCDTDLLQYSSEEAFPCDCGSTQCISKVSGFKHLKREVQEQLWIYVSTGVRNAALSDGFQVPTCSAAVVVRPTAQMGHALYATRSIPKGSKIFNMTGLVLPFPTVYTIFLGEDKHLLFAGGAQCLAHSCDPNTRIVVDPENGCFDCFSIRDIKEGDVISFNYLTTEWDMAEPFRCSCGCGSGCFGVIRGFRHLSRDQQLSLWDCTTKAIRARYAQTQRSDATTLAQLDTSLIAPSGPGGDLILQRDSSSGTVLFQVVGKFEVQHNRILFGDVALTHACDATAALLGNSIVLAQPCLQGSPITLNINQLVFKLKEAFPCFCGAENCCKTVKGFRFLSTDQQNEILLCALPEVRAEAADSGYINRSSSALVEIKANGGMGQATFSTRPISAGTRFLRVSGLVIPFPTVYTIMLEPGRHLLFAGGAQCLAHSCDPNVRIIVDSERRSIECVALRNISSGELISFNYLTTEWNMNTPFKCLCGSLKCFREIKGFYHLSHKERQLIWSMTSPAIRSVASSSGNWVKLSGVSLRVDSEGVIRAGTILHQGSIILDASKVKVIKNSIVVDGVALQHSCSPTACVIGKHVVMLETVCAGAEITLDVNVIEYALEEPFQCSCSKEGTHLVQGFKGLSPLQQSEKVIYTPSLLATTALKNGFQPQTNSSLISIRENGKMGYVSFAVATIRAGSRFLPAKGLRIPFPTAYTVMLNEGNHLLFGGGMQYLAHSCEPNVRLCVDDVNNVLECEALRDIEAGEIVAYNYNTTEWDIAAPFDCLCKKSGCLLTIRGFKHLTFAQRIAIQPFISPAVRELAGMYSDVQLPSTLSKTDYGRLVAKSYIPKERVVLEVFFLDLQPSQICVGRDFTILHSDDYNCVYVEGRIISSKPIQPGEALSVNLNYFVYDMTQLFPRAFSSQCKGFRFLDEEQKQKELYLCEPPVRRQAMLDGWIVRSTQDALTIKPNGDMGQTAYASRDIPCGKKLFHCTGLIVPFPTMYTICVGENQHLLFGNGAECIAHHCDPNVRVVVNGDGTFDFVSCKSIKTGEMVTFNYNTTEWDMNTPFPCLCGSEYCAGVVSGFKSLPDKDRQRLWPITSDLVKARC